MAVEEQVMIIYTVINKHLMDIPVNQVKRFETEFLTYLREQHSEIGAAIRDSKDLSEDTTKKLDAAIAAFKGQFNISTDHVSIV